MNNKINLFAVAAALALVVGCADNREIGMSDADSVPMADATEITGAEVALEALRANEQAFHAMLDGLTPEQLAHQESPERWSIAGVAEHIVVVENMFRPMIEAAIASGENPAAAPDSGATDEAIVGGMADRTQTFEAPPEAQPTGRYTSVDQIMTDFHAARGETIALIENADVDLRQTYGEHPFLGTIDVVQWVLFVSSHADRHLAQVQQVKDDPGYTAAAM